MHSLNHWRMLPPAGAPMPLGAIVSGLAAVATGERARAGFEALITEQYGPTDVFCAGSGRSALSLLFTALRQRHPERDQVLIPAYVSFSVPSAVVNAGCKVCLYDVLPDSLTPDYDSLQAGLSERTLAVVLCHQFGLPFDPAPAAALCADAGVTLVDDAAQAMGTLVKGRPAGTLADAGIFSFSRGKPMTSVDGGVLLTSDARLAAAVREILPSFSQGKPDYLLPAKALALGLLRMPVFYRLPASLPWLKLGASVFAPDFDRGVFSAMQAGFASYGLRRLPGVNEQRRARAAEYRAGLRTTPGLRAVAEMEHTQPIYLRFPVLPAQDAPADGALQRFAARPELKRLGVSPGFPLPIDAIPALAPHLVRDERSYPGARLLADNLITLPTHDQVRDADAGAILEALAGFARHNRGFAS